MKQIVNEEYHRTEEITKNVKPHKVAKILAGILKEKEIKKPASVDTIKRYFKEENIF